MSLSENFHPAFNTRSLIRPTKWIPLGALVAVFLVLGTVGTSRGSVSDDSPVQRQEPVEVPFRLDLNKIVVATLVNGHGPYDFVLDTGASSAFFLDGAEAKKMDLNVVGQAQVMGAGGDSGMNVDVAADVVFSLGPLNLDGNQLAVAPEGENPLGSAPWHGIFGRQVFDQQVVEIDWVRNVLRLHDPKTFEPAAGAVTVPLEVGGGHPFIHAEVAAADGKMQAIRVVIDSGAPHALAINSQTVSIGPASFPGSVLGRGLGGEIFGSYGRLSRFRIGDLELQDLLVEYPEEEFLPVMTSGSDGNLGAEVLRRFTLAFDYSRGQLSLLANKNLDQPFTFSTTLGISARRSDDGSAITVRQVYADSPAAGADLRSGDHLISIGGRDAAEMSDSELGEALNPEPGTEVAVAVDRQGEEHKVTLAARHLI